jgi:hypothetical protein
MADPVLLAASDDGLSYERAAVAAHLKGRRCGATPHCDPLRARARAPADGRLAALSSTELPPPETPFV